MWCMLAMTCVDLNEGAVVVVFTYHFTSLTAPYESPSLSLSLCAVRSILWNNFSLSALDLIEF